MMETPKPMPGTWTLTAPDGRTWQAESPLSCCGAEQRERVPTDMQGVWSLIAPDGREWRNTTPLRCVSHEQHERIPAGVAMKRILEAAKPSKKDAGFLARLFCTHSFAFSRNLYGDQIIEWGYKRSAWKCSKCGKLIGRDALHEA